MSNHGGNDVGSVAVDRSSHPHHFRLFSAASFRRKLLATLSCAGCSSAKKPPSKSDPIIRKETGPGSSGRSGSETLGDLFNETREPDDVGRRRKEERLEELRMAVRLVRSEAVEERENGAKLIRRLAKEDAEARTSLALIGAIPPLVGMIAIDDDDLDREQSESKSESTQIEALYALLNLGIGNDLNKAAIVQAGALHKMLQKIKSSNGSLKPAISEAIVANFLALSALDTNKPIIGSSGAIPFLVSILQDSDNNDNNNVNDNNSNNCCSAQAKQDALKALYNLSISSPNIPLIVNTGVIHHLVTLLGDMEMSERTLAILSNVVLNSEGRRSISNVPEVFPILIDALNWTDSPGCQEKASYILMIMAHKSYTDRQRMIDAGIRSALLELTLLGSTLAQKRASRLLECLRVDKGKQHVSRNFTGAVSAPICGPPSSSSSASGTKSLNKEDEAMMSEEKKAVKELVQQSLQNNMKRIVKRANLPQEFVPSEHLKSLTVSSTSKSLPF